MDYSQFPVKWDFNPTVATAHPPHTSLHEFIKTLDPIPSTCEHISVVSSVPGTTSCHTSIHTLDVNINQDYALIFLSMRNPSIRDLINDRMVYSGRGGGGGNANYEEPISIN